MLGGWLIEHLSWRWAFFLNLPLAVAVIAISWWRVPESKSSRARAGSTGWGALLATVGLGGLVFGFIEASDLGWRNPFVAGSLVAGVACLCGLLIVEDREALPMVPLTLFHSRAFAGANLLTFFLYAAIGIFFFLLPLNLIQVQGYSATAAGAAILPLILLIFLSVAMVGRIGRALRSTTAAHRRPAHCGGGFFAVRTSIRRRELLDYILSGGHCAGLRNGGECRSSDDGRDGVHRSRPGRHGIGDQQRRGPGSVIAGDRGARSLSWSCSSPTVLNGMLANMALPEAVRNEVRSNVTRLAALKAPRDVDPATASAINSSIVASFLFRFRLILCICAALALASAAVAWFMIPGGKIPGRRKIQLKEAKPSA